MINYLGSPIITSKYYTLEHGLQSYSTAGGERMIDWWFLCITIATGALVGANGFYLLTSADQMVVLAVLVLTLAVMGSWMNTAQQWRWNRR